MEQARPAGLRGVKVVTYHKSWTYLTRWLGLVEIGYIEPKPGVPPDPAHLVRLVEEARKRRAPASAWSKPITRAAPPSGWSTWPR